MDKMILSKSDLSKFTTELLKKNKVFAPVKSDDTILFEQIIKPSEVNLDFCNSNVPPKALFFHQTETLFKFKPGSKGEIEPVDVDEKKVILGIRPCDAKSLAILDHAFKGDYEDPYYLTKRKNTALIGLSCNQPPLNCCCTSFDDSPASSKYLDILLTDIGDRYYVEVTSDKGKQLTKDAGKLFKSATEGDTKKKKEVEKKAINTISRQQKTAGIVEKLDKIFENSFWKEVSFKCVGCGTCTYLCPTCHCFYLYDTKLKDYFGKMKMWDSCMRLAYAQVAGGANPRKIL